MKNPYELYPETYVKLLALIRDFAAHQTSDRLPAEESLAAQLGVSRVKIRDVLSQLEAAGYVTRKRGVGTTINRYVLTEGARLDIDSIYVDMVSHYGHRPRTALHALRLLRQPAPDVAARLRLGADEAVYLIEKQVFADDTPVIVVDDYIPARYYDNGKCDLAMIDTNIFFFLQSMCDELLETLMVHMDACAASGALTETMQVPEGYLLMKLDSVCYTQASEAILYSVEYYNTKILPFSFQKRVFSGKFKRTLPPDSLQTKPGEA